MCVNITWSKIEKDIIKLIKTINATDNKFDTIVSISNGGLIPAAYISKYCNIPRVINISCKAYNKENELESVTFYNGFNRNDFHHSTNILVVDDLIDSGITMYEVVNLIEDVTQDACDIFTGSLYYKANISHCDPPDFFVAPFDGGEWLSFPWERINI